MLRNYSLSDLPSADHYRVSVKLEEHGVGSGYLHHDLRLGDVLDVSAPRGTFTLGRGDGPVVLLSAGVGATPVLAMLHALAAEPSKREVWWLYGARNREEHPFFEESRRLIKTLEHGRSYICYSRPGEKDRLGSDFDAPGRIDSAGLEQLGVPREADYYLCGPAPFLRDLKADLLALGVSSAGVHEEIFGAEGSITPGIVGPTSAKPHQPAGAPGTGPRVSFARSGIDANWDPKYQSVLELAEACDVPVRWSCRTGVCHTCETAMISGSISYNPEPLQAAGRWQRADLLLSAIRRAGHRSVKLRPNLIGPLAARSPGLRFTLALEIERHGRADEILQCRLIDLLAFVNIDGASHIPIEAGVE